MLPPWVALAVRPRPGVWEYLRVNLHALVVEELQPAEYLHFKEELVDGVYVTIFLTSISLFFFWYLCLFLHSTMSFLNCSKNGDFTLELDFEPFNASVPRPTLSKYIGDGVEFLNRHLSAKLFHDKESLLPLLKFLRIHSHEGKVMIQSLKISLLR